jgi:DNA-directed RNA polymerase subunit beta'
MVTDAKGKIIPHVIGKSYAEGLDMSDYWTSMAGARRGMMDRALQTSLPGAFSKDIMVNTIDTVIAKVDCGTKKGILISDDSPDVL